MAAPELQLPLAQPRSFVPPACDCGDWAQLEPLFLRLAGQAPALRSGKALARWVLDAGELAAALAEEEARRYIRMTCQTDDAGAEKAYLHFVEQIEPKAKPQWHELRKLYLAHPQRRKLPRRRWWVHDREMANEARLYRRQNVPLQTEEARLQQQYQKHMGGLTVAFRGQERTLPEMARFLEEPDRSAREEAWRLTVARLLKERDRFDDCYDRLLKLRRRIARNAGFPDYRAYAFRAQGRFDYGPRECREFHRAVQQTVTPLVRKLRARRARLLGLDRLRPWDLAVDARSRPPLRPFADVAAFVERTQEAFRRIDPAFGAEFTLLRRFGLLDLESRKGKAPGGYQYTLEEARLPFIFMNAVGLHKDLTTLLHEGGHAFHALAVREEPLLLYRHAPLEFCEVASMTLELLAHPHYEVFYSAADAARARRAHLESIVFLLPWIAIVDAFQHWVYTHPDHTRRQRRDAWLALAQRFGGGEDWAGLEEARGCWWHRQPHLFTSPFYYIEYGIAQLGALQVWRRSQQDLGRAVHKFRGALALGRSRPLPELFRAAGLRFDFSERTLKPLIRELERELSALEEA